MEESKKQFTRHLSIKEIILIFSDIDVKITALNECSADDFLALNKYLKTFHKEAKKISGQTDDIYDIVAGQEQETFYSGLITLQQELKDQISNFKQKIQKSIRGLEKMLTALNLMFVPLKNFNLNLLTLSFLMVNLKLNAAYSDLKTDIDLDNETKKINELIEELKSILPEIADNLLKVKNVSRLSSTKLIEIRKRNILDIDKIINQVNTSINLLNEKQIEAAKKLPELSKKSENYFESVNNIITNLQYHDIIRQKMEHVQATHKEIINELSTIDSDDKEHTLSDQAQQFLQIRDIAGLQIAQLINTNKEYQKAFSMITKKFWDISEDMAAIASLSSDFIGDSFDNSDSFYKEIEDKLKYIIQLLRRLINANHEFGNEIALINQTIQKKELLVNDVNCIYKKLEKNLMKLSDKIKQEFKSDQAVIKIIEEIELLNQTLSNNVSDSVLFYNQSLNISSKLLKINKDENDSGMNGDLISLSDDINELLSSINLHNEKIDKLLTANNKIGLQVSSDIKSSVEQVKYYDFFEKIILEIINELNGLYYRLDKDILITLRNSKNENLKSIENRYTMETQRNIHKKVIDENDISGSVKENNNDSDIEFF